MDVTKLLIQTILLFISIFLTIIITLKSKSGWGVEVMLVFILAISTTLFVAITFLI